MDDENIPDARTFDKLFTFDGSAWQKREDSVAGWFKCIDADPNSGRKYLLCDGTDAELTLDELNWAGNFARVRANTRIYLTLYRLPPAKRSPMADNDDRGWSVPYDQLVGHPNSMGSGGDDSIAMLWQGQIKQTTIHEVQVKQHSGRAMSGAMIVEM